MENSVSNKSEFWKIYQNIAKKKRENELPEPNVLQLFFEKLYSDTEETHNATFIKSTNKSANFVEDEITNKEISIKEISEHIRKLKNNKATGMDNIMNEMLKSSNTETLELLYALFNRILTEGI